jgi:misacylated tRNA(Ala) deacylase
MTPAAPITVPPAPPTFLAPTLSTLASFVKTNFQALPSTTPPPITGQAAYKPPGVLSAQTDSTLYTLSPNIIAVVEYQLEVEKKKKTKGDAAAATIPSSPLHFYAMAFDDSVLFPSGGGQPCDAGTVLLSTSASAESFSLAVVNVVNEASVCIVCASSPVPLPPSILEQPSLVTSSTLLVDQTTRRDHAAQHTAQHLISALALDTFSMQTHSWSLAPITEHCYIDFKLVDDETVEAMDKLENEGTVGKLEGLTNAKIAQNVKVTPAWFSPEDEVFKAKVRSRLLPKGFTGEVRTVEIEGVDMNTCCGTHVPSLGAISSVKFTKTERIKRTTLRIYFVAGDRVLDNFEKNLQQQAAIAKVLSTPNLEEQTVRVSNLFLENKEMKKDISTLWEMIIPYKVADAVENEVFLCDLGESVVDAAIYKKIGMGVLKEKKASACFLISGTDDEATFFAESSDAQVVDGAAKGICALLTGTGGGKTGSRRGKISGGGEGWRKKLDEVKALLVEGGKGVKA